MATSNIKLFDENKGNMMGDTEYGTNTQRLNGVQQGIASSQLNNKFSYQTSLVAYALAQIMMQNGFNANDSDAVTTFVSNMSSTLLQKVTDKANQSLAEAGLDDTKYMTPLQVKNAINSIVPLLDSIASTSTKQLYGLGAEAVPDDVFAYLGQYAQHWWKRRAITKIPTETNVGSSSSTILLCHTNAGMYKIPVSDSIKYDYSADKFVQENPVIHDFEQTGTRIPQVKAYLLNKYVVRTNLGEIVEDSPLYRVTEDTVLEYNSNSPMGLDAYNLKLIGSTDEVGSWEYVRSSDRNAYPDSGTQDGYEYEYLGIPFENAVVSPKIETGSYVGTGTYGRNNPNSLTFGFVPKILLISSVITRDVVNRAVIDYSALIEANKDYPGFYGSFTSDRIKNSMWLSDGNKTLNWFNTSNASNQLNQSGALYYYKAFG